MVTEPIEPKKIHRTNKTDEIIVSNGTLVSNEPLKDLETNGLDGTITMEEMKPLDVMAPLEVMQPLEEMNH